MEYLSKFNLGREDINEIYNALDDMDISELAMHEERVTAILDYFTFIGINDLKIILLIHPNVFYEDLDLVREAFEQYGVDKAVKLINEDIINFDLIVRS